MSRAPPYVPTHDDRAVAAALGRDREALAFLRYQGEVLFARRAPLPHAPFSAVLDLLQGLHHAFDGERQWVSRQRVLTTAPWSDLDHAAVKVCADKLTADLVAEGPSATDLVARDLGGLAELARDFAREASGVEAPAMLPPDEAERAEVLRALVGSLPESLGPRHAHHRPVIALLVDAAGRVLMAARNVNGENRTLHAEVNLLQRWFAECERLPEGAHVVTSLQPCRMCAALLAHCAPGREAPFVHFVEPEAGRFGQDTVLASRGLERQLTAR